MPVAAIRGATTLDADTREEVVTRTTELVRAVLEVNSLAADDLVSFLFTASQDVTAEFPAIAVREMGITDVPLLSGCEMAVTGSMPLCIRLLLHVETDRPRKDYKHVYLRDAVQLRPDLAGS